MSNKLIIDNRVIARLTLTDDVRDNWNLNNITSEMIIKSLAATVGSELKEKISSNMTGFANPYNGESGFEVELYVFTKEQLHELVDQIKTK
jgi:hypothetical protein